MKALSKNRTSGWIFLTTLLCALAHPALSAVSEHFVTLDQRLIASFFALSGHETGQCDNASCSFQHSALWRKQLSRPHPDIATLKLYFAEAGKEFGVPVPLLEAIGQVENNWTQIGPSIDQGWGIMHLVENNYCDTIGEAAKLLKVERQILKDDARQNIRGAAALLAKFAREEGGENKTLEQWFEPVKRFSGLINDEIRELQAQRYYEVLREGVTASTLWNETVTIVANNEISTTGDLLNKSSTYQRASEVPIPRSDIKINSTDYGPALTSIAPNCNWLVGRTISIDTWVNHYVGVGTYAGAISWFHTCPGSGAGQRGYNDAGVLYGSSSAHFVIRASDGQITQVVRVGNTAYHAGATGYPYNNPRSIGVEHEVTAANPGLWNSAPLLQASTTMARYFCDLYAIPKVRALPGIRGHNEMPGTSTPCPGSLPWTTWMNLLTGIVVDPPPNDTCAGAIAMMAGTTYTLNTANATATGDPTPSCEANFGKGVWYTFTPSTSGAVTISTCASDFDTVIQAYTGACNSLATVSGGCNDDNGPACTGTRDSVSFSGTAGTTYRILTGGFGAASGNLSIVATVASSPPSAPVATAATSLTSSGFTANWNAAAGATGYRLDVSTSSTFGSFVAGYQNLDVGNVLSRAVSGLSASTIYYYRVRVYNAAGTSGNSGTINVTTTGAVPANDTCAGAIAMTAGSTYSVNTANATSTGDPAPSCQTTTGKGVWYTFTPSISGLATISTCGSDFDTVLYVHTGSCAAPSSLDCNDDSGPACSTSRASVSFNGTAGTTYRILAGGFGGGSGNLSIVATVVAQLPDLTIVSAAVTAPSQAAAGSIIGVSYTLTNRGAASGAFSVRVALGTTAYGTQIPLQDFATASLGQNQSRLENRNVTIPVSVTPGNYWVTVFADGPAPGVVTESDEGNNIGSTAPNQILITAPPATITVVANPSNGGTVSGGGTYTVGSSRQISATANSGWTFIGWSDGGAQTHNVTVPAGGATYTANFQQQTATIAVMANPSNGGTVNGSGTYTVGSSQQISATANNGWTFIGWSDGGAQTHNVTVPAGGGTFTANFVARPIPNNPRLVGTTFTVSVPTQVGVNYTLEYKNSTTDVGWTTGQTVSGTGGTITLTDSTANGSRRFYRVRVQ